MSRTSVGDLIKSGQIFINNELRAPLNSRERSGMSGAFPYYGATGVMDRINDFRFDGSYVLVAEDGTVFGENGISPMIQYVSDKFWVSNHAHVLSGAGEKETKYLKLALEASDVRPYITGAVQPKLSKNNLLKLPIYWPSSKRRNEILDVINPLDEKIERNRRMNETLEQIGQTLFCHYFIDRIRAGSVETVPLGKKLHPKRGKSLQSKNMIQGEVPVISGGLKPAGLHNESNTTTPVVTISASGANAGFVSVWGRPVWSADSSYIDSTITKHVYTYYLFLKNKQKEIYDMQTGSGQPHIYPKHIELLEIADLPDSEFDNFEQKVRPLFDLMHKNKKQIEALSKARDSLLPKLISGEIEV